MVNEDTIEQHCLSQLQALGWDYAYGRQIGAGGEFPWRAKADEVVFRDHLREAVEHLNPELPEEAVDDVITAVCRAELGDLAERNAKFYEMLRKGVRVEYQHNGQPQVDFARLIDFQQPHNNRFDVVNQLTIRGTKGNRRPDVICYVNGLPLVVFELKNPLKEQADLTTAYQQLHTYQAEISDLFVYNQMLVVSDGTSARVGSLTADLNRFMPWRVVDESIKQVVVFETALDSLLQGLFSPENLLNYVQNFVLFEREGEKTIKKIAAYHQFYGVNEAVRCTLQAVQGDRRIGVMWHTQGSGKSISMLFYAAKLLSQPALGNPTIVVVTDRNDLDDQLYATFCAGQGLLGQAPVQVESRDNLRLELAKRETGGILFTTIQKFGLEKDEERFPTLNERSNIIVISDEAHRSQYGFSQTLSHDEATKTGRYRTGLARHLRNALPNASFIGFTGTPISQEDRDTQEVFGHYVSIYDLNMAINDGATVPLFYQARRIGLSKSQDYDAIVQEIQGEYGDEQSKRLRLMEQLMGSKARLAELAADFVKHYAQRTAYQDGKAMIVAMSRRICVQLYNEIIALKPEWHSDEISEGEIKVIISDPDEFQPHIHIDKKAKKLLEKRFKDPEDPLKVVIVCDMWLTGFDVPCCNTMYIDKPMQGHNLMQAIARVNRVFRNKSRENGGLLVDYAGIGEELTQAYLDYTHSGGQGEMTRNVDEVKTKLLEHLGVIRGQFATPIEGNIYPLAAALAEQDQYQLFKFILQGADHILGLDGLSRTDKEEVENEQESSPQNKAQFRQQMKRSRAFVQRVGQARKGFALCGTLPEVQQYDREISFFEAVKAVINKEIRSENAESTNRLPELVQLLNQAVKADGTVNLLDLLNKEQMNISVLSADFLNMVKNSQHKRLWLQAVEQYLERVIKEGAATNLALQKDFAARLKETMNKYHNQHLNVIEVLEELLKMAQEFEERRARGEKLGLSPTELAFYEALLQNKSAEQGMQEEVLKRIATEITLKLRESATIDFQHKTSVRSRMRMLIRRILQTYKYPPDKQEEAIDFVLNQAEVVADELSGG